MEYPGSVQVADVDFDPLELCPNGEIFLDSDFLHFEHVRLCVPPDVHVAFNTVVQLLQLCLHDADASFT